MTKDYIVMISTAWEFDGGGSNFIIEGIFKLLPELQQNFDIIFSSKVLKDKGPTVLETLIKNANYVIIPGIPSWLDIEHRLSWKYCIKYKKRLMLLGVGLTVPYNSDFYYGKEELIELRDSKLIDLVVCRDRFCYWWLTVKNGFASNITHILPCPAFYSFEPKSVISKKDIVLSIANPSEVGCSTDDTFKNYFEKMKYIIDEFEKSKYNVHLIYERKLSNYLGLQEYFTEKLSKTINWFDTFNKFCNFFNDKDVYIGIRNNGALPCSGSGMPSLLLGTDYRQFLADEIPFLSRIDISHCPWQPFNILDWCDSLSVESISKSLINWRKITHKRWRLTFKSILDTLQVKTIEQQQSEQQEKEINLSKLNINRCNMKITIAIPSVSIASHRLKALLPQLQKFTNVKDVEYIVSDDGTPLQDEVEKKKVICDSFGVKFIVNDTPDLSSNLNFIFKNCDNEWVAIIEDGVLPSFEWLDAAYILINNVNNVKLNGPQGPVELGMLGLPHIEAPLLALVGFIPTTLDPLNWIFRYEINDSNIDIYYKIIEEFYKDDAAWNNGNLTYKLFFDYLDVWKEKNKEIIFSDHINLPANFSSMLTHSGFPYMDLIKGNREKLLNKKLGLAFWPGGLIIVKRALWEKAGGFLPGFNFYEGWMGSKAAYLGYISLSVPSGPFIHLRSQGFMGRTLYTEKIDSNRITALDTQFAFTKHFGMNAERLGYHINHAFLDYKLGEQVNEWNKFIEPYIRRQIS